MAGHLSWLMFPSYDLPYELPLDPVIIDRDRLLFNYGVNNG